MVLEEAIGKRCREAVKVTLRHLREEDAFASILQRCSTRRHLLQLEAQVAAHGLQHHRRLASRILSASFALASPHHAALRFRTTRLGSTPVPWNVMSKGLAELGSHAAALRLFEEMRLSDVRPSGHTFTSALKSCAAVRAVGKGRALHSLVLASGLLLDCFVGTALLDFYAATGELPSAGKVFDEMREKNVVASTAIVRAHILAADLVGARRRFDEAERRDVVLWSTMLSGYIRAGDVRAARELFDRMPDRDLTAWNIMLHGYANGGNLGACLEFFHRSKPRERDEFSWNALMRCYMNHDRFFEALLAFRDMLRHSWITPNEASLVIALSACSRLGALEQGRWIHVYANEHGFIGSTNISNALVDMYAKCGEIEHAVEVFRGMTKRDVVSWNTMISGFALHGYGVDAIHAFDQMKCGGYKPDGVTYVGVLSACNHARLVREGFELFGLMTEDKSVTPSMEHYGCMVDLLGRSGMLSEAVNFIRRMPIEADCVIWSSLLGASHVFGNVGLAELAMKEFARLQPSDAARYVALSNVYGAMGRWRDLAQSRHMIRIESISKKVPGCSSIEVDCEVVEFYSSDVNHPSMEEIYSMVHRLNDISRMELAVVPVIEHLVIICT